MEEFTICGETDFIKIEFLHVYGFPDKTCCWGGYDVNARLEIKSRSFNLKSSLCISTGEIYDFFQKLNHCYKTLNGTATLNSYEGNLKLITEFDGIGHVIVKGIFSEQNEFANELKFEFWSDQTFIRYTVDELEQIIQKYGDNKGIINSSQQS